MKTVLIIIPFFKPNIGGVETRFNDICQYLAKNNYRVKVITYQPITTTGVKGKSHEIDGNLEIFRLWWPGFDIFHKLGKFIVFQTFYTSSGILVRTFFYLLFNSKKIDVIHAAGFNGALVAKVLNFFFRKRWIVSTHAIYGFKKKSLVAWFIRWIIKSAYKVICLSGDSKNELINIGVPEDKITIHITWVNQDLFKPHDKKDCRQKLSLEDRFTVIFVGRFRKIKGILNLIKVAGDLKDINFIFAGEGPEEQKLRQAASESKNIIHRGKVSNQDLPQYYNAADVSIMPSLYEEPFGRVVIESLSCGIPCICSNLGGIVEHLDSAVCQLIYPGIEEIKKSILEFYRNPDKLRQMSSGCRKFAEEKFSQNNMASLIKGYGF
jgi:glycosyltransferase involved in cell wall biosynthesis